MFLDNGLGRLVYCLLRQGPACSSLFKEFRDRQHGVKVSEEGHRAVHPYPSTHGDILSRNVCGKS